MPSTPITVYLNANAAKKFVVLLPSAAPAYDTILKEARNKFRSKALFTVYLRGGELLSRDGSLPPDSKEVWIAKDEPYNGPEAKPTISPNTEFIVLAENSFVDNQAVQQLRGVACLPGMRQVAGMPDLHPGNRFPIGFSAVTEGGIYPALVGSDIGCGIALYALGRRGMRAKTSPAKMANTLRGLDDPWSGDVRAWLSKYNIGDVETSYDATSLGTVGAGNHFAEITTVEKVVDVEVAERMGLSEDVLCLLVHTGSRGLGGSILAAETATESNPYLEVSSPKFVDYLRRHDHAVKWGVANRDLLAHRIASCLFADASMFEDDEGENSMLRKIVDVTHNAVTRMELPREGTNEPREVWVHRKGAAPADRGVAPCPGSRGDYSWLLQPVGDGVLNAYSLAHGAGRRHPRHALHDAAQNRKKSKADLTTTALGSEVVCTDPDLLIEEQPEAYKDIASVVQDMESKGMCKGVVMLRPLVSYKIREHGLRNTK